MLIVYREQVDPQDFRAGNAALSGISQHHSPLIADVLVKCCFRRKLQQLNLKWSAGGAFSASALEHPPPMVREEPQYPILVLDQIALESFARPDKDAERQTHSGAAPA